MVIQLGYNCVTKCQAKNEHVFFVLSLSYDPVLYVNKLCIDLKSNLTSMEEY